MPIWSASSSIVSALAIQSGAGCPGSTVGSTMVEFFTR